MSTAELLPDRIDQAAIGIAPVAPPARPRVLLYGTSLAIAAIGMAYAALLGIYLTMRADVVSRGEEWLPSGVEMPLTPGNMAFATLVLLGFYMQWAVWAVAHDDRPRAYFALGLTALMGGAYITEIVFYYSQIHMPLREPSGRGLLFYAITGGHLAMVAAGLVFLAVVAFRTLGGQYSGRDREGLTAAAIYWYATIAVYSAIWFAIFITK